MTGFFSRIKERAWIMRRRKDSGFVLLSTLVIFVLVGGSAYAMLSTTGRTIQSSVDTRNFTQAGMLADQAIQDATHYLNETPNGTKPTSGSRRYSPADNDKDGVKDWNWYASAIPATGARTATIYAEGTFRGTTRKVSATVGAMTVGGWFRSGTDQLSYELSPKTAFTHTILGRNVTVQNGLGVGNGATFITGLVGSMQDAPVMKPFTSTTPKDSANYILYGAEATSAALAKATRVHAATQLDPLFITERTSNCRNEALVAWKASSNGGKLTANNADYCFSSMDFDVPTTILGSNAANVFVAGNITVTANITATTTAALNIYTGGNVTFTPDKSTGTSLSVANTFVYAPSGTCKTAVTGKPAEFRSTTKSFTFVGSLACDTVKVAGKFTGKTPVSPLGSTPRPGQQDTFNSEIWYITDYQQPAGVRK